jgi:hypothetical protein
MAMKWNNQLVMKGTAWNIPADTVTAFNPLVLAAQAAYNESGMTVYYCIRYENNKGDKGPWGPMVQAVIP